MPTWCHMFNSTLTGNERVWFDDLPQESIDSYDDLKKEFLENYLQQKKCIKYPVEIHNIRQRSGESTEEFMRRYKLECRDEKLRPLTVNRRSHSRHGNSKKLTKSKISKNEAFETNKGSFKAPPPMTTSVEKQNHAKFCEFHSEVGHNTGECIHLRKQIEEMLKVGKLSHLIKELKQNNGKEQPKVTKKGETSEKDKALAILMVQPWERVARQRITQSFSPKPEIFFPLLGEDKGTEGPMIIEAEIEGHCIYRMYVDDGSALKILYEHHPESEKLHAVPSTVHRMLKIPVEGGIITLKSSRLVPLECVMVSGHEGTLPVTKPTVEERIKVAINPEYPEQTVMIGFTLTEEGRNKLCSLLQSNLDIFAWKPANMTGIPRHIVEHRLNVHEGCLPVRQKKRGQATDRNQAIQEEVGKLIEL
ncbi:reverse transcriptase domain-containing protein [Tanacetum coccineum]